MKAKTKAFVMFAACAVLWASARRSGARREEMAFLEGWRYAHRGLHDMEIGVPENTLPAFGRAFAAGFGAELDVHLTSDGRLAVIHDSRLDRLCGQDGVVEEMSYDTLRTLDILQTQNHAPLLEDVLDLCRGQSPLIIEIKTYGGNYADLCQATARLLDGYDGPYCIESFDPRAVLWFRQNRPSVIRGQLSANFMKKGQGENMRFFRRLAMTHLASDIVTRPDFVAYRHDDSRGAALWAARRLGAKEVSWTVRDIETMEKCEKRGSLVIFENFVP